MKIVIEKELISPVREIPEWVIKAMVGLEVETSEYDVPWLRFGNIDLAPNNDNFYTIRCRDLFIALDREDHAAARELSFLIPTEIIFFLFEKDFCKEKLD